MAYNTTNRLIENYIKRDIMRKAECTIYIQRKPKLMVMG